MKRVLLIAFYFPPRNHIAGYRTGCFAKYLPEQGWLPTVISSKPLSCVNRSDGVRGRKDLRAMGVGGGKG